jgi:hypothetical protein
MKIFNSIISIGHSSQWNQTHAESTCIYTSRKSEIFCLCSYFYCRNSRPPLTFWILCYLFFSAIVGLVTKTHYFYVTFFFLALFLYVYFPIIICVYNHGCSETLIEYFLYRASVTQYFFLLGIQYTSATFACAFVNMVPVITFLLALPFG